MNENKANLDVDRNSVNEDKAHLDEIGNSNLEEPKPDSDILILGNLFLLKYTKVVK